jgi:RNA recognition motif-containing protein
MKRAQNRGANSVAISKNKEKQRQDSSPSQSPVKTKQVKKTETVLLKKKTLPKEENLVPVSRKTATNKKLSPKNVEPEEEEVIEEVKPTRKNVKSPPQKSPQRVAESPNRTALFPKVEEGVKIVFVGNLPLKISQNEVSDFFAGCGKIVEVRMSKGPEGFNKGFCHVEFDSTSAVRKAIQLNGKEFSGRAIRIDPTKQSKSNYKFNIEFLSGEYVQKKKSSSVKPATKKQAGKKK